MEFVSIGPTCQTIDILKGFGLKGPSYPFDVIFSCLKMVKHCIDTNFEIFLDKQYYTTGFRGETGTKHSIYREYVENDPLIYANTINGHRTEAEYICLHHDLVGNNDHYEAFQRRTKRFMDLIKSDKQSVLVYRNRFIPDYNDIIEFSKGMTEYKKVFILGILDNSNSQSILYESENCRIYQNYNHATIFEEIKQHLAEK